MRKSVFFTLWVLSLTLFAVNGKDANVLSGAPVLSITALTSSAIGDYPISAVLGKFTTENYDFASVSGTLTLNPPIAPTNIYNFTYADRDALLADGWSFIATNPDGTPRNSEITDTNIGAVVSCAQTNDALGIVTRIPCDIGFLYSSATTIPDAVQDVPPMFLANQTRNSLFRSLPTNWVSMQLTMSFALQGNYQHASLVLYQDDDNYVDIGFRYNSDLANSLGMPIPTLVSLDREFYGFPNTVTAAALDTSNIVLRLDRESGTDVINAFYSLDGTNWVSVGQTTQALTNTQFGIVLGASPNTFPLEDLPVCDLSQAVIITSDSYSPPPPILVVQPQHLVFNAIAGQPCTATQRANVVVKNSAGPVNWSVSSNAAWLSASIVSGQTPGFSDVSVDTTGLLPGTHEGVLTFTAAGTSNSPATMAVTLIVNPDNRARVSAWHDTKSGAMSVSIDDSNPTAFDNLSTNGVKGSFAMWHLAAPAFYTDYYNAGMELASHTVNHVCFEMQEPAFRFEIEGNIAGLVASTPVPQSQVISFAWPCGSATIPRQVIASDYFLAARGYNLNQLEDAAPNDFMNVKSYNSHENTPMPPGDFKTLVDAAMAQSKWFNLVLHEVDNENGAIGYAATNNIWVAPIGSVAKYILQRDRTVFTNYTESASLIQFDCYRLPLDPSKVRSFETAIGANDTLTLQVDVTGIPVVSGLTVNNVPTPYTNRVVNSRTLLCFNLSVGTNAQTVAIPTAYQYPLTVTADNKARVYGAANPSFTGSLLGAQPGHNITATYTTIADTTSPIGSYAIVPVLNDPDGQLTNYIVTTNVGALTISPASLTVAADAQTKIYGNGDPTLTYQITNGALVNSDNFSGSLNRTGGENVGVYAINQGSLSAGTNYFLTFVPNNLSITPHALTITANNQSKTYGAANPQLTASYNGFVAGENTNALSALPSLNTSATTASSAGSYTISAGGASAANYSIAYVDGLLSVNKAWLTVTADNATRAYGFTNSPFSASFSGFVNLDDTNALAGSPELISLADTNSTVAGSPYTIAVTNGSLAAVNYDFIFVDGLLSVTQAVLTVSADNQSKLYGAAPPSFTASYSGFVNGEDTNVLFGSPDLTTAATVNSSVAGNPYAISAAIGSLSASNYSFVFINGSLNIATALLSPIVAIDNKIYDATTAATITNRSLSGVFGADDVSLVGGSATFSDKNAGLARTVIASGLSLSGAAAPNYILSSTSVTNTADITARSLTVTATGQDKVYDGTTSATVSLADDRIANDSFTASYSAAGFADKHVTANKSISVSGIALSGDDALNYTANTSAIANASITARPLSVSAVSHTKIYDSTTASTATPTVTLGSIAVGDSAAFIQTFDTKNVGTNKTLTASGSVTDGNSGNNYTLSFSADDTGAITTAPLTASIMASNKVYDTTAAAIIASRSLATVLGADDVSLTGGSATFADANAGPGKLVTATGLTLSGVDAANYLLVSDSASTLADIFQAALTITADNQSKTYGAANPQLTASYNGFVAGENTNALSALPSLNTSATTASSAGSYTISAGGASAANYSIAYVDGLLSVNKAWLTVTADNATRAYGFTNSPFSASFSGFVNLDDTNALAGSPELISLADTNSTVAGSPYTIAVTNGSLAAVNYDFIFVDGLLSVTQAVLTVSADNQSKLYGAAPPSFTASYSGFVNGEDTNVLFGSPDLTTIATVNSSVAGNPYAISAAIGSLSASNYSFVFINGSLNIATALLSPIVAIDNKIYDATTAATITNRSLSGVFGADDVSLVGGSATFSDKNAGLARTVIASGLSLSGAAAPNYILSSTSVTNTADITARSLTVTATGQDKVYDGTTSATVSLADDRIANDSFTASYSAAGFADKHVTANKSISVSGIALSGDDALNYTANTSAIANASITARPLSVSAVSHTKIYDSTTASTATPTVTLGSIAVGDSAAFIQTFDTKNVGTNKTLTASGSVTDGNSGNNYTLSFSANHSGVITKVTVAGHVAVTNKVYDGTTAATIIGRQLSAIYGSDDVSLAGGTATFSNPNAGTGKTVIATGLTLSGADATNYALAFGSSTTSANITKAPLTVIADNKTRTAGLANPALTAHYTGFVAGQNTNVLTSQATLDTAADVYSPAGVYPITASGAAAANYSFEYVDGTLTVVARPGLNNTRISGSDFTFTVSTLAGEKYQIEYAQDLGAAWVPLGDPIIGTGQPVDVTTTVSSPHGFFRVKITFE